MENNAEVRKRKELDALRGIAITGIVLYHLFPNVVRGGFLGVPLFFVLSGYLMFMTSSRRWEDGDFHIIAYYKKRAMKIIPPLFIMIVVVCSYLTLIKSNALIGLGHEICSIFLGYDNWWQISRHASYFSGLSDASPFTHLWFLAVEIQFYLLWPFLFLLYQKCCEKAGGKKMCFAFLLLALLSAGKMFFLYSPGADPSRVYYGTDTMAFPLLLGMFLGAFRQEYGSFHSLGKKTGYLASALFLLVICTLFMLIDGQNRWLYQGGMFCISLFFAFVIHVIENLELTAEPALLSLLGRKSYGIYLWHYPLIILM